MKKYIFLVMIFGFIFSKNYLKELDIFLNNINKSPEIQKIKISKDKSRNNVLKATAIKDINIFLKTLIYNNQDKQLSGSTFIPTGKEGIGGSLLI